LSMQVTSFDVERRVALGDSADAREAHRKEVPLASSGRARWPV
jgi:hypothetical protein